LNILKDLQFKILIYFYLHYVNLCWTFYFTNIYIYHYS